MEAGVCDPDRRNQVIDTLEQVMSDKDCVGSFNMYNDKLWGSFLIKQQSVEGDLEAIGNDMSLKIYFIDQNNADEDNVFKCLSDWARGDQFILF